ncbi:hypothetical protein H4W23_34465 [Streptomyces gardneri]|uniref:hypothetical protein n=1 Tax=Streptomyces gardneri TaxID=66892 RepID=UPI000A830B58|nr:hypothetical protein [Streptomyces gardneri]QPK50990.1 hypothetical protein H4W23_34465 [Streptomyces gardneri]WRK40734.1 hypothetical protein U0M97_34660 [Streptomyces venezuelae]
MKAAITADEDEPLPRKPDLAPIPQTELPRQFEAPSGTSSTPSPGPPPCRGVQSLQSGELGIGFALTLTLTLTLTGHMLRSRFPDHSVTIVPADTAIRAG